MSWDRTNVNGFAVHPLAIQASRHNVSGRDRTYDLLVNSQLLYLLSYRYIHHGGNLCSGYTPIHSHILVVGTTYFLIWFNSISFLAHVTRLHIRLFFNVVQFHKKNGEELSSPRCSLNVISLSINVSHKFSDFVKTLHYLLLACINSLS